MLITKKLQTLLKNNFKFILFEKSFFHIVDNVNAYEKMKKELYKRELTKQIEEKRLLERRKNNSSKKLEKQLEEPTEVPLYLKNPFMKQNAESWTSEENNYI